MNEQRLDDQLEPIYNGSMPIQNVALRTCRERWTIETGGEIGIGKSVLAAHDNDDDIYVGHSINKGISRKELVVRSTGYSCTFFYPRNR